MATCWLSGWMQLTILSYVVQYWLPWELACMLMSAEFPSCWPVLLLAWHLSTRLETRTKESNACVSFWAVKLCCVLKEIVGMFAPATNQAIVWGLSGSMCVRTRKMVNYAWGKQGQGKLWWRLVAILTCKSFVILEYRGERLIEPSSSWFPPKFPSG